MKQQKENAEDRAYRLITELLIKAYKPGDYLFESVLTQKLGMSRTPVSIALNRLIAEGLLKKRAKKGCYIPKINLKDAQDLFTVRRILEIESIRAIIAKQDENVLAMLRDNLEALTLTVRQDDYEMFYPIDLDFHRILVFFSQNDYLYEAWNRIFIRCMMYTTYFHSSLKRNQFYKENILQDHNDIFEAIKNGDVEHAIQCMITHLDHIVSYAVDNTLIYDNM